MKTWKYGFLAFSLFFFSACGTSESPKPVEPPSPPPVQAQTVDGKAVYEKNCVACHGPKGLGDGPAAVALPNKPADLTLPVTQKKSDDELAKIISEGRQEKGMPPWKNVLKDDEVNALVKYLRELSKK